MPLSQGRALGYRKGSRGGVWLARYKTEGFRKEEKLALADDILDAEGARVLDFGQAQEKARTWFLTATSLATGEHVSGPGGYTVHQCCLDYLKHLERRGAPDYRHTKYDLGAYAIPKLGALASYEVDPAKARPVVRRYCHQSEENESEARAGKRTARPDRRESPKATSDYKQNYAPAAGCLEPGPGGRACPIESFRLEGVAV